MAAEIIPDGAFPELFGEYVEYKRNLGYVYPDSRLYLVRRLSGFLAGRAADERVLTREAAEEFARPREGESSGSAAGRRGIARQFALFLRWKGIQAWVLPERARAAPTRPLRPRIITAEEMARIIACADAPSRVTVRAADPAGLRDAGPPAVVLRAADRGGGRPCGSATWTWRRRSSPSARPSTTEPGWCRCRSPWRRNARRYAAAVGFVAEDPRGVVLPFPRGGATTPAPPPRTSTADARGRCHHGLGTRSPRP